MPVYCCDGEVSTICPPSLLRQLVTQHSKWYQFTVHFHQQLIQRVLLFTVTTETSAAALSTDGVDFIDEQNARRILACHRKHITNLTTHTVYADVVNSQQRAQQYSITGERNSKVSNKSPYL